MANTLLTPTMITREAQMVLHQKLNLNLPGPAARSAPR